MESYLIQYPCPVCSPEVEPGGPIEQGYSVETPEWPLLLEAQVGKGKVQFIRAQCEKCGTFALIEFTPAGMVAHEDHSLQEDRRPTADEVLFRMFLDSDPVIRVMFSTFQNRKIDHAYDKARERGIGAIQARQARGDFDLESEFYTVDDATKDAMRELRSEMEERMAANEVVEVKVSWFERLKKKFWGRG